MSVVVFLICEFLVIGGKIYYQIIEDICLLMECMLSVVWVLVFIVVVIGLVLFVFGVVWMIWQGIGIWDFNWIIGWSWDIINFVWWVGIGYVGIFILVIFLLFC